MKMEEPSGAVTRVPVPSAYISNFINRYHPRLIHYAGHGDPQSWSEVSFSFTSAAALTNVNLPGIVMSAGCETAMFAVDQRLTRPPTAPFTGSLPDTRHSMAEAFVTRAAGGGVIYMGAVVGTQSSGFAINEAFFQAIADGTEVVGEAWLAAVEALITLYDLDDFTQSG